MSTYTPFNLLDAYLPNALGDLLTVTGGETWVILGIDLGNVNAAQQAVKLYTRIGSVDQLEIAATLPQYYTLSGQGNIVLPAGAKLRGVTTTASAVRCVISGYKIQ